MKISKLFILLLFLVSLDTYGQQDIPYYNGKLIPLNIDSVEAGYFKIDTLYQAQIIYWYKIDEDTIGKLYWYNDNSFQKLHVKSLVKYRPDIQHSGWSISDLYYFGLTTHYRESGEKLSEIYTANGKMNGRYSFYYKTGILKETGYYKDGKATGKWLYYNKDGQLIKTKELTRE